MPKNRFGVVLAILATTCGVPASWSFEAPPVVKTRLALDALGVAAVAWQNQFDCSGCHKQPITLAAFAAGAENRYESPAATIVDELVTGMLSGTSGQGADGCLSFAGGPMTKTVATTFGGRGLEALYARYTPAFRTQLLAAADCLLPRQAADGRLPSDHSELPAAQGDSITTAHGVFTWARSFEVTADPSYQQAADLAVAWIRARIDTIAATPASFTTQDKAMLIAGLGRSGAGPSDADIVQMRNLLAAEQLVNGSWKLANATAGGNAYATGMVIHAMTTAGFDRTDPAVDLGVQWLLANQQVNGLWPVQHWQGGVPSSVAPSMWAALALASFPSPLGSLRLAGGADAVVQWPAVEGADSYDLIRGRVQRLQVLHGSVDLGAITCLAGVTEDVEVADPELPEPGDPFFYVMRIRWDAEVDTYGRSSDGLERTAIGGCP